MVAHPPNPFMPSVSSNIQFSMIKAHLCLIFSMKQVKKKKQRQWTKALEKVSLKKNKNKSEGPNEIFLTRAKLK